MGERGDWWLQSTQGLLYRCVCGTELNLFRKEAQLTCPKCWRVYDPLALQQSLQASMTTKVIVPAATVPDANVMALKIGDQLEHFQIIDVLGQGGMGKVYRAIDESLERYVALKVIDKKGTGSNKPEFDRLLLEARAQARLNHPNVVQIYYVQHRHQSTQPFFAMELVQGDTLEQRLKFGPLEFTQVIDISLQVVSALKHARIFDIVHGDIKPSNILFSNNETVKLADFGLAKISSDADDAGLLAGTPAYMSPEIVMGQSSDFRSDMYSLGIMLYRMCFFTMPYTLKSNSVLDHMEAHKSAMIEFPTKWPDAIPKDFKHLIEKLLAKNPCDRFQNYELLQNELERLRPNQYPIAARATRGLAWLVDLSISLGLNSIIVLPIYSNLNFFKDHPVLRLPALALPLVVPYLVCFLQGYWKTSPGKKMFQLCIMDRHGKPLARTRLEIRMAMQMLPLMIFNIPVFFILLGPNNLGKLIGVLLSVLALIDLGAGLFAKGGRSFHDWLLGTQVVLDVSLTNQSSEKTRRQKTTDVKTMG